jgi:hypothetical protein
MCKIRAEDDHKDQHTDSSCTSVARSMAAISSLFTESHSESALHLFHRGQISPSLVE